jgi:PKD repeat protein
MSGKNVLLVILCILLTVPMVNALDISPIEGNNKVPITSGSAVPASGTLGSTILLSGEDANLTLVFQQGNIPTCKITSAGILFTGDDVNRTLVLLGVEVPTCKKVATTLLLSGQDVSTTINLKKMCRCIPTPLPGFANPPTDPDGDCIFEDLNGNNRLDFADVVLYFNQMEWIAAHEPASAFDLNGNGRIDFADIVMLFGEI